MTTHDPKSNSNPEADHWHMSLAGILIALSDTFRADGRPHLRDAADVLRELASDLAAGESDARAISRGIGLETAWGLLMRGDDKAHSALGWHVGLRDEYRTGETQAEEVLRFKAQDSIADTRLRWHNGIALNAGGYDHPFQRHDHDGLEGGHE